MLVSIVTPSFNQAKFLPKTLESVCKQVDVDVEHIVVDPGSTDNSREIAEKSKYVILIAEHDKGQSDGIHKGFKKSTGEILAWLNSDDYYPNNTVLSTIHEIFRSNLDIDIVYGNANFVDQDGNFLKKGFVNRNQENLKTSFQYQIGLVQPAVFWRRKVFEEIGGPSMDYEYCMDYEYWVRMALHGYTWRFVPKVLAHHRWWDGMKTSSHRDLSFKEHFKICQHYYGYVHWKWIDRYAVYLATQIDGIVNHSVTLPTSIKDEYIRKAIKLIVNDDMFSLLEKSNELEKIDTFNYILKYKEQEDKVQQIKKKNEYAIKGEQAIDISNDPVLVYQMGKVASSTIYESLKEYNKYIVHHIHRLNPDNIAQTKQNHISKGYKPLVEKKGLKLYKEIFEKKAPAFLISLVREPIGRNISAYFQNLDYFHGNENTHEKISVLKMIDDFLYNYSHEVPLEWFDIEMKPVTGIDVFNYKFNKNAGYIEIEKEPYKLLLLRYDLEDSKKTEVIRSFLDIENFELKLSNVGLEKVYSSAYKDFLSKIVLPEDYVDRMLESRFTKHFFDANEIDRIRNRWLKVQD